MSMGIPDVIEAICFICWESSDKLAVPNRLIKLPTADSKQSQASTICMNCIRMIKRLPFGYLDSKPSIIYMDYEMDPIDPDEGGDDIPF